MKKNKRKILTVCHDAGGAEIVSAYGQKNKDKYNFVCLVAGPAIKIFQRKKLAKYLIFSSAKAKKLLAKAGAGELKLVLTGTGWGSAMELDFIRAARQQGIKSVAYLEHWVNLRERFNYPKKKWQDNLPDEFWAGNKHTHALAKKFFKKIPCKLVPNLYFKEMKEEYKKIKKQMKSRGDNILFMSQPIKVGRGPSNYNQLFQFSEFDVLEKLLKYLSKKKVKNRFVICYHPSEKKDKYDALIAKYADKLKIEKQSGNRLKDIAQAKIVIGITSTILVIAKLCDKDKRVISFIPDKRVKCPIPFADIIKINKASAPVMKAALKI